MKYFWEVGISSEYGLWPVAEEILRKSWDMNIGDKGASLEISQDPSYDKFPATWVIIQGMYFALKRRDFGLSIVPNGGDVYQSEETVNRILAASGQNNFLNRSLKEKAEALDKYYLTQKVGRTSRVVRCTNTRFQRVAIREGYGRGDMTNEHKLGLVTQGILVTFAKD